MVSYNHRHLGVYACVVQLLLASPVFSFVPTSPPFRSFAWQGLSSTSEDITSLRVSEIKKELKDRGISFQDCFDKESLVQRLQEARDGKVKPAPKKQRSPQQPEPTPASKKEEVKTVADTIDDDQLLEELRRMSVKALRQELASRQIHRAGLLEKEDVVQALFKARKEVAKFSATGLVTPGQVADLTGAQVLQELKTPSPMLLDVYAVWCGPCQMMERILKEVAVELGNQVRVAKMDSDKYIEEASQFRVQGLPTLVLFNNGQEVDRIEGAMMKDDLVEWVKTKL